jgi:YD repeat-containing protein
MATTRKKKEVVEKVAKPAAKKATAKKQTTSTEPVVVKGNHLTVTTHPDGRTELVWDDDALLQEVRNALLKAESTMPVGKTNG